jgi:para-nitrobenzyl esterase
VPVHAYEFSDENAPERFLPPLGFPYGAAHASELQYLFDLGASAGSGALTAGQQRLAAVMRTYWTQMARTGAPSGPGVPSWPAFHVASPRILTLAPPLPGTERGFAASHHCSFWAGLAAQRQ